MKSYDVVAAGKAYTDIIASVPADFLEEWEIPLNGDRLFDARRLVEIYKNIKNLHFHAGGPSGNTVSTISALGGQSGYFGKIGHDEMGEYFRKDFEARHVAFINSSYCTKEKSSATALILETPDGNRSIAFNAGCSELFVQDDFRTFDFSSTQFFLVEAHLLLSSHAEKIIRQVIVQAKTRCQIVINLQGLQSWGKHSETVSFININSDIIIGNEVEHTAFAKDISQVSKATFVITKGENGAESRMVSEIFAVPALAPKNFKGSTGAGDAFTAGFLLARSRGMDMPASLRCGVRAATAILEEPSGRPADKMHGIWAHLMNG